MDGGLQLPSDDVPAIGRGFCGTARFVVLKNWRAYRLVQEVAETRQQDEAPEKHAALLLAASLLRMCGSRPCDCAGEAASVSQADAALPALDSWSVAGGYDAAR
jgi:Tfp pilus assembly protein PilW